MDAELKDAILGNRFVERLRGEMVVDRAQYEALCEALRRLAAQWEGARLVEKEVAQELYVLAPITQNMAARLRPARPELADEVEEMAVELDALVLECFDA